jgi:hypothetical protein
MKSGEFLPKGLGNSGLTAVRVDNLLMLASTSPLLID